MGGLRFDFGNLMAERVENGVTSERLDTDLAVRFLEAHQAVEAFREAGNLGFLNLPYATETVDQLVEIADGFAQWCEDVVVLGIGGSGLGAAALKEALLGPFWNARDAEGRDHFPRLHIVDNPDPCTYSALLSQLDPARTLFNVVSKSGETAETMAQYLVAREWVESGVDPDKARGHFLFTTDPEHGALRQIGEAEGIALLPLPANVGGRFSVLSTAGLFPAVACGVDPRALLRGAAEMEQRCATNALLENPAGLLAVLLHQADTEQGRPIHVFMPYADRLAPVARWFQQLWAESLGKAVTLSGESRNTGPTPLAALGATDQHSMLQLLMDGPHNKVVVFVGVTDVGVDMPIPERHRDISALSYLGGHSLGELLSVEHTATAEALRQEGRPNATLTLPKIDAQSLGELLMLLQLATVYAGGLYGVNPLDQPGVELGKQITYGLMGRTDVDRVELKESESRWVR